MVQYVFVGLLNELEIILVHICRRSIKSSSSSGASWARNSECGIKLRMPSMTRSNFSFSILMGDKWMRRAYIFVCVLSHSIDAICLGFGSLSSRIAFTYYLIAITVNETKESISITE